MSEYNLMSLEQKARYLLLKWTNELDAPVEELRLIEEQQTAITILCERLLTAINIIEKETNANDYSNFRDRTRILVESIKKN